MFKKDNVKNLREKFTPRPGKNFFGPPISKSYLPPCISEVISNDKSAVFLKCFSVLRFKKCWLLTKRQSNPPSQNCHFFRFNSGSVKLIHTLGKDKKDTI